MRKSTNTCVQAICPSIVQSGSPDALILRFQFRDRSCSFCLPLSQLVPRKLANQLSFHLREWPARASNVCVQLRHDMRIQLATAAQRKVLFCGPQAPVRVLLSRTTCQSTLSEASGLGSNQNRGCAHRRRHASTGGSEKFKTADATSQLAMRSLMFFSAYMNWEADAGTFHSSAPCSC